MNNLKHKLVGNKKANTRCAGLICSVETWFDGLVPDRNILTLLILKYQSISKSLSTKNAAIWSKRLYYSDSFGFLGDKCLSIPWLKVSRLFFLESSWYRFRRQRQINGFIKNSSKCAYTRNTWPAQPIDRIAAGTIKHKLFQGLFTCLDTVYLK